MGDSFGDIYGFAHPHAEGRAMSILEFAATDLATPEVIANPYPAYAALRPYSPVPGYVDYPPGTVPGVDEPVVAWALLTHEQVREAARDHQTFSSRDPLQEASDAPTLMLVNTDQPLHSAHRKVVNTVFTRSRVEAMRPWLVERVGQLVADLPAGQEIDAVHELCAHVPAVVMCKFFGAPDSDAPKYERWANAFMLSADLTGEERNASNLELGGYFVALCQARAEALAAGEEPGDGLIDALLLAEADGEKLTFEEIVRFCITLVVAGSETSMYFGANVVDALLDHPEAAARVREDRSLIKAFLDETLRLTGPPQRLFRVATRDVQVGEAQIKAGDWVALFFAAANHDPEVFPDPERFDLDRPNANRHMTYGLGIHYCLGAPLATLEVEVMVGALFDRFERMERGPSEPVPQTATLLQHSRTRIPIVLHEKSTAMTAPTSTESLNVRTTRTMYAAVPAGDAETVMANIHPDIETYYYGTDDVPYAGTYHGAAGFGEFLQRVGSSVEVLAMDPQLIIEQGDHLAVFGHLKFRTLKGTEFESDFAHIIELRDGKWFVFRDFANSALVARVFASEK